MNRCGLCGNVPRCGDNMALVRVMPGQPHWDALAASEAPGQTSIGVYACWDCRCEFSVDYFGLPREMMGERPWAPPRLCCQLCKLPYGQDYTWPHMIRILRDDTRYPEFSAGEPEEQTSVSVYACEECYRAEIPEFLARTGIPAPDYHLV